MSASIPKRHPLRRMFSALTEQTFMSALGVGDPQLTEYISNLLARFVHRDAIWWRSATGKRLQEVAEMMAEASISGQNTEKTREIHRHIGDYTLFWSGAYPEALKSRPGVDSLLDYQSQGKRAYWIASQYDDEPYRNEAPVLRLLSEQFELCAFGLNQVRQEWERADCWKDDPGTLIS